MKKSNKFLSVVAIGAIIFLAATNIATAYLLISKGNILPTAKNKIEEVKNETVVLPSENQTPETAETPTQTETPAESEEISTTPIIEDRKPAAYDEDYILKQVYLNGRPKLSAPAGMKKIAVDYWYKGENVKAADFFTADYKSIANMSLGDYKSLLGSPMDQDGVGDGWIINLAGVISSTSDKYAGQNLYELNYFEIFCEGPGCESDYYMFAVADKEARRLYILSRYSTNQAGFKNASGINIFTEDALAYIAEMENPETIDLPGTDSKLNKISSGYEPSYFNDGKVNFYNDSEVQIADAPNGKKVYLAERDGCFRVYNENGSRSIYEITLSMPVTQRATVLNLTFNDGSRNKNDYISKPQGGCGTFGCASLVAADSEKLKAVGKFGNGDTAFEYSNTENTDHDQVLWKVPLENYYLAYTKASLIQAAECGKPVIYLYPTEKTDVKVQVAPNGGFSITDPAYGDDGWLVSADPQSNLLNYADGKNYPYLFWEGKAVFYQRPNEGFVVARENIDSFFNDKLAKLGMIEKEINDFKEFWVPKFTEKPYYFITFLPKSDFDQIAPLKVEPRPQTIIRVFMDYQGLDAPIKAVEPKITTPKRRGFTVVEWGGALNRK